MEKLIEDLKDQIRNVKMDLEHHMERDHLRIDGELKELHEDRIRNEERMDSLRTLVKEVKEEQRDIAELNRQGLKELRDLITSEGQERQAREREEREKRDLEAKEIRDLVGAISETVAKISTVTKRNDAWISKLPWYGWTILGVIALTAFNKIVDALAASL